jgi:hypothetical protein
VCESVAAGKSSGRVLVVVLVMIDVVFSVIGVVDSEVVALVGGVVVGVDMSSLEVLIVASCARESGRKALKDSNTAKDSISELQCAY